MEMIRYRGAYRFADRAALEHAVATALANHTDLQPQFSLVGSSLCVVLDLPARSDRRHAAAQAMQTLANHAIEGIVVARHREHAVDVFVCG